MRVVSGKHIAHRKATAVGGQVRAPLLVSVLDPPFTGALAAGQEALELSGLGPFIMTTGLAGIIGDRLAGRLVDRSSRGVMLRRAAASSWMVPAPLDLAGMNASHTPPMVSHGG